MIFYGKQSINQDDINAVIDVLANGLLTQGPRVPAFEHAVARRCHADEAVAVNSATSALHIACLALGLTAGDSLWTVSNTFVASANCAFYCGATVDFVDIDLATGNLCASALRSKIAQYQAQEKPLPKIVVAVHFAGQSCAMAEIAEICREHGIKVIEDASHAIGGEYQGQPIGNCQYSDITIFSFHPVKIITSAEGGMALTNNAELAQQMRLLRSHGITKDPSLMANQQPMPWDYEQVTLGYNYRLTDLQAALGLSQLHRIDEFVEQRNTIARYYDSQLADVTGISALHQHRHCRNACHLYVVLLDNPAHRKPLFDALLAQGYHCQVHYISVASQPYFVERLGADLTPENSRIYSARALSLPIYPELALEHQQAIVAIIKATLCNLC